MFVENKLSLKLVMCLLKTLKNFILNIVINLKIHKIMITAVRVRNLYHALSVLTA
jgi:hypothetical protein